MYLIVAISSFIILLISSMAAAASAGKRREDGPRILIVNLDDLKNKELIIGRRKPSGIGLLDRFIASAVFLLALGVLYTFL